MHGGERLYLSAAGLRAATPAATACVEGLEKCDDGNVLADGDGCSADCLRIDAGYSCPVAGQPCVRCGNGVVETGEACDDGNQLRRRRL